MWEARASVPTKLPAKSRSPCAGKIEWDGARKSAMEGVGTSGRQTACGRASNGA